MASVAEASEKSKGKPVKLELDDREHRELRAVAGLGGTSMSVYARQVVVRAVRAELERRNIEV